MWLRGKGASPPRDIRGGVHLILRAGGHYILCSTYRSRVMHLSYDVISVRSWTFSPGQHMPTLVLTARPAADWPRGGQPSLERKRWASIEGQQAQANASLGRFEVERPMIQSRTIEHSHSAPDAPLRFTPPRSSLFQFCCFLLFNFMKQNRCLLADLACSAGRDERDSRG